MKKGIAFVLTVALLATLATGCASSMTVAEPTIEPVLSATAEPTVQQGAAQEEAVSIVDAKVNENGELILYMSNNTTINAGLVRGEDGKDGVDGLNGADGKDGVNGKNGRDGVDGKDGADGKDGRDGIDGTNGRDGVDGKDGKDGQNASSGDSRKIELKNDGTNVCWRYEGDSEWQTLISLADITGKDGKDGAPGKDGADGKDGKDGAPGKDGADGKDGKDGIDGVDGKPGADGKDGADGQPGADGREVELRTTETHIQWRYVGDTEWKDLIALSEITGPKGDKGDKGDKGNSPYIGENGNWWVGDQDTGVKAEVGKEQPEFLYNETGEILLAYNGTRKSVTIPAGVRKIGPRAFYKNEYLETVNLPYDISKIGEEAFCGCTNLRKILFDESGNKPENLTIEDGAFRRCSQLEKLWLFRYGVIHIEDNAFRESGIEKIEIFGEEIEIASHAFMNCDELYSINFKTSGRLNDYDEIVYLRKVHIYNQAFENCKALEKVIMCWHMPPLSDLILEEGAFTNCPALYAFNVNSKSLTRSIAEKKPFKNCPKLRKIINNCMRVFLNENSELYPEVISPELNQITQLRASSMTITDKSYNIVVGTIDSDGNLSFSQGSSNQISSYPFLEQTTAADWDQCGNKEKYLVIGVKGFDRKFADVTDENFDVNINGQYFGFYPLNSCEPEEINAATLGNNMIRRYENGGLSLYFVLEYPNVEGGIWGGYGFWHTTLTITVRGKTTDGMLVKETGKVDLR